MVAALVRANGAFGMRHHAKNPAILTQNACDITR